MLKQGLTLSGTHLAQSHYGIQRWRQLAAVCRPHRLLLLKLAKQCQGLRATRLHIVCQSCPQTDKERNQRAVRRAICHLQTLHIRSGRHTFPAVNSHDVIARARGNCTLAVLSYVMFLSSISPETTRPSGDRVINRTALTLMTLMMYGDWLKQKVIFLDVSLYVDTAVM